MADLETVGEEAGWRCWLCDEPVPKQAKPNDPNLANLDQIEPRAKKGTSGRGEVRLAHRRCNNLRKARQPSIPWPERFGISDAPELHQSLLRLDKRPGNSEIVAMAGDRADAEAAAAWVLPLATLIHGGTWEVSYEALASMTAIRLSKQR